MVACDLAGGDVVFTAKSKAKLLGSFSRAAFAGQTGKHNAMFPSQ